MEMSIEGKWKGVYRYAEAGPGDDDCPFTADLTIVVWEIMGTITDHREPVKIVPFRSTFEACRHRLTYTQIRNAEKFLRAYPDAAQKSELPLKAEVYGERSLSRIRFEKSYSGLYRTSWLYGGGEKVISETTQHKVWYEGALSPDEQVIEGTWNIRRPGVFGRWLKPLGMGTFRMEKC
jgi:hypothetical protein